LSQVEQACDGGCASFVLSVAPANIYQQEIAVLPTMLIPVTTAIVIPGGSPADSGCSAVTPYAVLDSGTGAFVLPYDDSQSTMLTVLTEDPDGGVVRGLTVTITSQSLEACAGDCNYNARGVSDSSGQLTLPVPLGGYLVSVSPPYEGASGWFTQTTVVSCVSSLDCGVEAPLQAGVSVTGQVVLPNGTAFDDQGEVEIFTLPNMNLVSSARFNSQGQFSVIAPQGRDMVVIVPDAVTGYPSVFETPLDSNFVAPEVFDPIRLSNPGLLAGTVSVEGVDGGPFLPVGHASVQFYYVVSDPLSVDGGEIALPISSTVTDSLGNFATVGPPLAPGQ
jgi:hypothetical protein